MKMKLNFSRIQKPSLIKVVEWGSFVGGGGLLYHMYMSMWGYVVYTLDIHVYTMYMYWRWVRTYSALYCTFGIQHLMMYMYIHMCIHMDIPNVLVEQYTHIHVY